MLTNESDFKEVFTKYFGTHFSLSQTRKAIFKDLRRIEEEKKVGIFGDTTARLGMTVEAFAKDEKLPVRAQNALSNLGCEYVCQIVVFTRDEAKNSCRNLGNKSLDVIEAGLRKNNLFFGMDLFAYTPPEGVCIEKIKNGENSFTIKGSHERSVERYRKTRENATLRRIHEAQSNHTA